MQVDSLIEYYRFLLYDILILVYSPIYSSVGDEMDVHTKAIELHKEADDHKMKEMILHPILQIFLELKWDQVKKIYWFRLFLAMAFTFVLTLKCNNFFETIYCRSCEEMIGAHADLWGPWTMTVYDPDNNNNPLMIQCFGKSHEMYDPGHHNSSCGACCENGTSAKDLEWCAHIGNGTSYKDHHDVKNLSDLNLRCHKDLLR